MNHELEESDRECQTYVKGIFVAIIALLLYSYIIVLTYLFMLIIYKMKY